MQMRKGISLVVLVITIIVMIILAGAVVLTLNNAGIIDKAGFATKQYTLKEIEQIANIAWTEAYLDDMRTQVELENAVKDKLAQNKITESDYEGYELVVTENGVKLENKEQVEEEEERVIAPGLYQTGSDYKVLLKDWNTLVSEGIIKVEAGSVSTEESDKIKGDLVLLNDGSITEIGGFTSAFGMTEIVIPDTVTTIGDYAFSSASLKKLSIPDSVVSIGKGTFNDCSLKTIIIPDNVTSIGGLAFAQNSSLETAFIGKGVTIIADGLFQSCSSLKSVSISKNVVEIGAYAFLDCGELTQIIFDGTTSEWNKIKFTTDDDSSWETWNQGCPEITVICNNGNITIPAFEFPEFPEE